MAAPFFLHYADEAFDRFGGVYVPFGTREEAERQAANDLGNVDDDLDAARILGIFQAEYGGHQRLENPPAHALYSDRFDYDRPWGHLDADARKKIASPSEILKAAPKHQRAIRDEILRGHEQHVLAIHELVKQGRLQPEANQPGSAWAVMTGGTATAGAIALTAATAKTVLMLIAGTSDQPILTETQVSFDGITATAVPVLVEFISSTQAGAGTTTAATPKQVRGWTIQVPQTTAAINYTVEPTVVEVYRKIFVSPNGGVFALQEPLGREPTGVVTASTQFKGQGIRLTAPAAVNTHADQQFEE